MSTEDGTGIVHIAPGFGEDDYALLKGTGRARRSAPWTRSAASPRRCRDYAGPVRQGRGQADHARPEGRRAAGQAGDASPTATRTAGGADAPLIYRAIAAWFVSVEKIKREHARGQRRRSTGCRRTCKRRPLRQLAGGRPRLGHLAQPLLGQPPPDLAVRRLQAPWSASAPARSWRSCRARR